MRIILPNDRPKQEMKASVERSIDQLFAGFDIGLIEFIDQRKQWSGDTMMFSLTAKVGFLRTPIIGSAMVTEKEVVLDVDLGLLGKLIPEDTARTQIAGKAKRLLLK
jgi:hypothetical protein